jgi:indolepyruvate ferredoxin oxidoreductase alpha subunit
LTATKEEAKILSIEEIARACGAEFVKIADPYDLEATQKTIEEALHSEKFAIVVCRRACTLQALRMKEYKGKKTWVNLEKCTGCKICITFGCSAMTFDAQKKKASVDLILCVGCGMCKQICPSEAIEEEGG